MKQRLVLAPNYFVFFVTQTSLFTSVAGLGLKEWIFFSTVDLGTYEILFSNKDCLPALNGS